MLWFQRVCLIYEETRCRLAAVQSPLPQLNKNTMRAVITVAEAARRLGVSLATVYKMLHLGSLEGFAVGRRRLVYEDDIEAFQLRSALGRPTKSRAPAPSAMNELPNHPGLRY